MPNLTIRNLPPEVTRLLRMRAKAHRRSLNREVNQLLSSAVTVPTVDPVEFLARAREIRSRFRGRTTSAEITRFKRAGRT